jgi:hypothetical protein
MTENHLSCAGVAQLGEQQTEALSILEVPCSIHGPGIFYQSSLDVNFFCIYRVLSRTRFEDFGHVQGSVWRYEQSMKRRSTSNSRRTELRTATRWACIFPKQRDLTKNMLKVGY